MHNKKRRKVVSRVNKGIRHLHELIPEAYKSLGSIEGTLEAISIHNKNPKKQRTMFVVYESLFGKAVSCRYGGLDILEKIKASLGRRVRVRGLISRNLRSEPRQVMLYRAEDLEIFGEDLKVLPFRSLGGSDPDFTGDLSTEEFIRRIRG